MTDHDCIIFSLSFKTDCLTNKRVKCSRFVNHCNAEKFSSAFDSSVVQSSHDNTDCLVSLFNSHCSVILDEVAPLKTQNCPCC